MTQGVSNEVGTKEELSESSPSDISKDAPEEKQGHGLKKNLLIQPVQPLDCWSPCLDFFMRFELFLQWFMLIQLHLVVRYSYHNSST